MTKPLLPKHLPLVALSPTSMAYDTLVASHTAVGYVQDAHGIRGDMHWVLFADEPDALWTKRPLKVWLCPEAPGKHRPKDPQAPLLGWWLEVKSCQWKNLHHKTIGHVKVQGITTREMALGLKGCELWVSDTMLTSVASSSDATMSALSNTLTGEALVALPLYQYRGLNVYSQASLEAQELPIAHVAEVLETGDGIQCFLELQGHAARFTEASLKEKPLVPLNTSQVLAVNPVDKTLVLTDTLYEWLTTLWEPLVEAPCTESEATSC
jgi:hypothetical protein